MNRRHFLALLSALSCSGLSFSSAEEPKLPSAEGEKAKAFPDYDNTLQDRLWMWGHDSGQYDGPDGVYNIPLSEPITMADAIRYMDIPNVCVIRGGHPDAEYRKQFKQVKRLTWNLSSGSNESYYSLRDYDFGLLDEMPNLIGFDLDDFFQNNVDDVVEQTPQGERTVKPGALSLNELAELHKRVRTYSRPLDLRLVLYSFQLTPTMAPAIEFVDTVSFWTWSGSDLTALEGNFRKYREIAPSKPTLLGIYMWNFGEKKPLEMRFMEHQLDTALRLFKEGEIEGLIFHCTPLCNKKLPAVEYCREWIRKHGKETR